MAQIARDHPESEPPFHPVLPMIGTFAPPIVPPQAGNAPLDARTPPVSSFEAPCMFQGLAFLRECACCWDRHPLDPHGRKSWLRLGGVHAGSPATRPGGCSKSAW